MLTDGVPVLHVPNKW